MSTSTVLPASLTLGAVQLRVGDLERSLEFYRKVVGFRLLKRESSSAELGTVDGRPLLRLRELGEVRPLPRRAAAGLYHFAILLPDREGLGLVLRNLIQAGLEIGQGDHLVSEALYIQDPDGNGIELYRDRPAAEWTYDAEGQVVMTTDPVDIDGLLAASADKPWDGLPSGTGIGHVHFHVGNLERARRFYCEILGFDLTARYGRSAMFVSAGGYHHHIGLNVWAGEGAEPAAEDAPGIDFFTLVFPDAASRERLLERLETERVTIADEEGVPFLRDPWRIGIRLTVAE